jgi:hypothetical protein
MITYRPHFRDCMADLRRAKIDWMQSYMADAFAMKDDSANDDSETPGATRPFLGWGVKLHRHNWYACFALMTKRPTPEQQLPELDRVRRNRALSLSHRPARSPVHPRPMPKNPLGLGIPCDFEWDPALSCGRSFPNMWRLHNHLRDHIEGYKKCPCTFPDGRDCGKMLQTKSSLNKHVREVHSSAPQHKCHICGKMFKTKGTLDKHLKIHEGSNRVRCDWPGCGKSFCSGSSAQVHVDRMHRKLRPFSCALCDRVFSVASALRTHEKDHTDEDNMPRRRRPWTKEEYANLAAACMKYGVKSNESWAKVQQDIQVPYERTWQAARKAFYKCRRDKDDMCTRVERYGKPLVDACISIFADADRRKATLAGRQKSYLDRPASDTSYPSDPRIREILERRSGSNLPTPVHAQNPSPQIPVDPCVGTMTLIRPDGNEVDSSDSLPHAKRLKVVGSSNNDAASSGSYAAAGSSQGYAVPPILFLDPGASLDNFRPSSEPLSASTLVSHEKDEIPH